MVEDGALQMLIDLMANRDGESEGKSPEILSPTVTAVLPMPKLDWDIGHVESTCHRITIPSFREEDVSTATENESSAPRDAPADGSKEETDESGSSAAGGTSISDIDVDGVPLGQLEKDVDPEGRLNIISGLAQARNLSRVALTEALWVKQQVSEMALSAPILPPKAPSSLSESDAAPSGSAKGSIQDTSSSSIGSLKIQTQSPAVATLQEPGNVSTTSAFTRECGSAHGIFAMCRTKVWITVESLFIPPSASHPLPRSHQKYCTPAV